MHGGIHERFPVVNEISMAGPSEKYMFDYDPPPDEKKPVDYSGVIIGLILVPVYILVTYLSNDETALAVFMVLGAIIFAIKMRWNLRKHLWFWAVVVLLLALHTPLIFVFRVPEGNVPTIFYTMPIGIADFFIVLWAVDTAETVFSKDPPSADEG